MNAQTTQGNTPLMYAASYCGPGSDDIVQLLLKHGTYLPLSFPPVLIVSKFFLL